MYLPCYSPAAFLLQINYSTNRSTPCGCLIAEHIRNIVLVNRSRPDAGFAKTVNIVEGVLTNEGLWADQNAAVNSVSAAARILQENNRYRNAIVLDLLLKAA